MLVQPKLGVSQPNDALEQEADRVADQVLGVTRDGTPTTGFSPPAVQCMCQDCGQEQEGEAEERDNDEGDVVHAQSLGPGGADVNPGTRQAIDAVLGRGRALPHSQRAFFEQRFGHDFGQVRVHTDSRSAATADALRAKAYTMGRDIVFGPHQYSPHTLAGRRLLAHELTHVVQQSTQGGHRTDAVVQRKWDWGKAGLGALIGGVAGGLLGLLAGPVGALVGLGIGAALGGVAGGLFGRRIARGLSEARRRCRRLFARIRRHPVYRALAERARAVADDIMNVARQRDNCLYYAEKLKLLLDTPEAPSAVPGQAAPQGSNLERNRRRVNEAANRERTRLATDEAQREFGRQEQVANDPGRQWTERRGRNNKIFYVDRSDPEHIVARIKIRLLAAPGVTTQEDIGNLVILQDAAERIAETRGYTLDVVFVNEDGPDIFTFNIDFDKWPTAANPVGNARTLAHEIHHLMGLKDRYDYIESHAANPRMSIPKRLHWFREQMNRQRDPDRNRSLMGSGTTMLDDDVCRVAGLDLQTCMAERARALEE